MGVLGRRANSNSSCAGSGSVGILNTGAQWHMLPQSYPNYKTVHRRFQTWCCHEILRRPRTHREGDHFHFAQQIFILSREGLARRVISPPGLRTSTFRISKYQRTSTAIASCEILSIVAMGPGRRKLSDWKTHSKVGLAVMFEIVSLRL